MATHPENAPDAADEIKRLQREVARRDETITRLHDLMSALNHLLPEENAISERVREIETEILDQQRGAPFAGGDIAHEFQRRLLPTFTPRTEGVRIASRLLPAAQHRGDLYDVFDMGASCLGIFIGDVSGTGLPAALVMTIAKMSLHTGQVEEYSPRAILGRLNLQLYRSTLKSQFMTAFFGVLDTETNRLKYVNASQCPPFLYGAKRLGVLESTGAYCGMLEDARYEEREVELAPGDHLLLYTDGLTEAMDPAGDPFTAERLEALVREEPERDAGATIEAVLRDLERHLDGQPAEDDVTLLGIDILPRKVKEDCVTIPTEPKLLPKIEDAIQAKLNECNYGERSAFAVRLAVEEAVINAMKHGNQMDKAKTVTIRWSIDDHQAVIVIEDEGEGFEPSSVPDPTDDENIELPHGRGLVLIRAYMDEVSFNDRGNQITMVKLAPWRTS